MKAAGLKTLPGRDMFTLYDTFGFPVDLTELILRENDLLADVEVSMPKCSNKNHAPATPQLLKQATGWF